MSEFVLPDTDEALRKAWLHWNEVPSSLKRVVLLQKQLRRVGEERGVSSNLVLEVLAQKAREGFTSGHDNKGVYDPIVSNDPR